MTTNPRYGVSPHKPRTRPTGRIAFALLVSSIPMGAALAQAPIVATDGLIEKLKPGKYLWAPEIAPAGPVTIIVSLKTQQAYVYRNGVVIGVSTISSGIKGRATPTGIFTILQKETDHLSNLYDDAPMPFMQRLTWDGIAMHGGNLPGYPASHGCIRLPLAFAKLLFGVTRTGITVVITQDALVPIVAAAPAMLMANSAAEPDRASGEDFRWTPERSPTGPVSIVVSGRDRRMVVLRNGIEIGSSAIRLDVPIEQTSAFTLQSIDATGEHWLRLPIPGETRTGELSVAEHAQGHLPDAFRVALATVLTPGATLLATRETLASAGTGKTLTIIEAEPN